MAKQMPPDPSHPGVYRVLAAVDELTGLVDKARNVPMSASCVLPRGTVLDLVEDIRDALPAELADAQDVLDKREDLLTEASERLSQAAQQTQAEWDRMIGAAHEQASQIVAAAQAHGERVVAAAQAHAERMLAQARAEAETIVAAARHEAARHVEESEVLRAATAEADQIRAEAVQQARQMVAESEEYVDGRLASFSEMLTRTLRQVDMGRQALRERAESTSGRRTG